MIETSLLKATWLVFAAT